MKFDNHCASCGKLFRNCSYAIDKQGTLETMYCDSVCRTNFTNKKRFMPDKLTSDAGKKYLWENGRLMGWKDDKRDFSEDIAKVKWNNYKPGALDDTNVLGI